MAAAVRCPPANRAEESLGLEVVAKPAGVPRGLGTSIEQRMDPGLTSGFGGKSMEMETFSVVQNNFPPQLTARVQLPSVSSTLSCPTRKRYRQKN